MPCRQGYKYITGMKIQKNYKDELELAEKIVGIILMLSDKKLPQKELELLSFLSYHGSISTDEQRQEFYDRYNTTYNTYTNLVSALKKKGLINKINDEIKSVLNLPVKGTTLNVLLNVQRNNQESSEG